MPEKNEILVAIDEAKKALEDSQRAFDELKKTNDARLKALEAKSGADPLFDEKLSKINRSLNDFGDLQRKFSQQQDEIEKRRQAVEAERQVARDEEIRRIEAKVNRTLLGLGGGGLEEAAEQKVERKAYGKYLRHGLEKMAPEERKVLTVGTDTTGGYLAPATYVAEIIKAEVLYSPMRQIVTLRQVGTGEFQQPKRTTTAAATWAGETATRSETTNPAWGLLKIPVHEMYAEARISWANLEDSAFDLESLLRDEFAEQFGVTEGAAICSGSGVGRPLGFLDANAAGPGVPIAFTVSGAAATIAGAAGAQADGLINLFHAVKTAYARNGTWVLNRGSLGAVRLLKDTAGNYLWAPQPGVGGSVPFASPGTILGAPYMEVPDMPDQGANTFPVGFGDWRRAITLVERIDMSIVRDNVTVAGSGQVKFFARRRIGAQTVLGEAVRLLKCST